MSKQKYFPTPALRMEAGSINCKYEYAFRTMKNSNLLTIAESLTACYRGMLVSLHESIAVTPKLHRWRKHD